MNAALGRPQTVSPLLSAGAIGLCLAVSALPVLVGIVRELPMADRALGNLALRIAALDDAILWIGLALLLFLHDGTIGSGGWKQLAAIGLFALMLALGSRAHVAALASIATTLVVYYAFSRMLLVPLPRTEWLSFLG